MYGNVQTLPFSSESTLSEILKRFGVGEGYLIKLDLSKWEVPPEQNSPQGVFYSSERILDQPTIHDLHEPVPQGHYVLVQKRVLVHRGWPCYPNRNISNHTFLGRFQYTNYYHGMIKEANRPVEYEQTYPSTKFQLPRIPHDGAQSLTTADKDASFLWFCLRMRILEGKHGVERHAVRLLMEIQKCQEKKMCFVCKHNIIYGSSLFCDNHQDKLVDQVFQDKIKKSQQWRDLPKDTKVEDDGINRVNEKFFLVDHKNPQLQEKMKQLGHKDLE